MNDIRAVALQTLLAYLTLVGVLPAALLVRYWSPSLKSEDYDYSPKSWKPCSSGENRVILAYRFEPQYNIHLLITVERVALHGGHWPSLDSSSPLEDLLG